MTANKTSLDGKLILVTGAGTGIGQGVALELARQGADIAVSYNSSAQGATEVVEQVKRMGRRVVAIQANLGVVADCYRLVDGAAAFLGGLDGVVNNAGLTFTLGVQEVTEEMFDKIYRVNVRGQYFCCQRAIKHILERGEALRRRAPETPWAGGSLLNMGSVHGVLGFSGHSVYAGTKGAINAFSRELAVELCPLHIRVNVMAPGSIEVPSYFKNDPNYTHEMGNGMVPWGRVGEPEDVGYLAAYLMSDASEFMTGHIIALDGGLAAKMAIPYTPPKGERS
jgi:NAD(P)-dependent dehydrogenase (short-subunit alcohol dehydrogenase family)